MSNEKLLEQQLDVNTQKNKYLIFKVGNESFGIEILYVTEIVSIQPITDVPDMPMSVQGIINLRGQIIPVIDIRLRLKKEFKEYDSRTCIIVLNLDDPIGIIVDNVTEVLYIPEANLVEPPLSQQTDYSCIKNVGKIDNDVKLIIDCANLVKYYEI